MSRLLIENLKIQDLKPFARNPRMHSKAQVRQIVESIEAFGFTSPLLIDDQNEIIVGHGRLAAARLLNLVEIPCIRLASLSRAQKAALRIADNKIPLGATWDEEFLARELENILNIDCTFDLSITGFSASELDCLIEGLQVEDAGDPRDDALPQLSAEPPVTRPGDIWLLGPHRLVCGNGLDPAVVDRLMAGEKAMAVWTDPPFNLRVDKISGLGKTKHREFAMASGEMSRAEFTTFLTKAFRNLAAHTVDGGIAFVCGDWRHLREYLDAGESAFSELKNLIVWDKLVGGMGSFYRSRYELIFAFKSGTAPHANNFELGQHGRYRTNVWPHRGLGSFGADRDEALASHPTVKPVGLISEAIKDVSTRGAVVLDLFGGSGSTLIAAHKTGRRARLCEIDPAYCDVIIRRFEAFAKDEAVLQGTDETFAQRAAKSKQVASGVVSESASVEPSQQAQNDDSPGPEYHDVEDQDTKA